MVHLREVKDMHRGAAPGQYGGCNCCRCWENRTMVRGPHCCGRLADAAEERLSTSHIRTRCSSTQQEPPIKARQVYSHGGRSRSGSLITADSEVVRGASACTSARSSRHSALDVDQSVSRQRWHVVEVVDNHSFAGFAELKYLPPPGFEKTE